MSAALFWTCAQCTFANNQHLLTCEICGWSPIADQYKCTCRHEIYCAVHNKLNIFLNHQKCDNSHQKYPSDTDDLRYLSSVAKTIAPLIMFPELFKMLTKVSVKYVNNSQIVRDVNYYVQHITLEKTGSGIEITGPELQVFKKIYDFVATTTEPACIEIISGNTLAAKNEIGIQINHSALLVIHPSRCIYLIDPNLRSVIDDYKSESLEAAILKLLPDDSRFMFIPQKLWLADQQFVINGKYDHLGISSGWCRVITASVAGAITRVRCPMNPTDVLKHIASMSEELRILMFIEVARIIVINGHTVSECDKLLNDRRQRQLKFQQSTNPILPTANPISHAPQSK